MSQRKVTILDPEKEARRKWEEKRAGKDPSAVTAAILFCQFCGHAIPPSQLLIDIGGRRACTVCAKKDGAPA